MTQTSNPTLERQVEDLRELWKLAQLPILSVNPDERPGMEWNDEIVFAAEPDTRVAFMANGPHANARSALIVALINAAPTIIDLAETSLTRLNSGVGVPLDNRTLRESASLALMYLDTGFIECPQCGNEVETKNMDAAYELRRALTNPTASPGEGDLIGEPVPETVIQAAYLAIYGDGMDPLEHPEGWEYAGEVAAPILAAIRAIDLTGLGGEAHNYTGSVGSASDRRLEAAAETEAERPAVPDCRQVSSDSSAGSTPAPGAAHPAKDHDNG